MEQGITLYDLFTHYGLISYADYFTVIAANIVTILMQAYNAQQEHGSKFKLKILIHENYFRWLLSMSASLFLLYVAPEGYLWFMETMYDKDPADLYWNTLFSAAIGLSPLYFLKKLIRVSKSKFRDEVEK